MSTDRVSSSQHLQAVLTTVQAFVDDAVNADVPASVLTSRQQFALTFLTFVLLKHLDEMCGDPVLASPIENTGHYLAGDPVMADVVCQQLSITAPDFEPGLPIPSQPTLETLEKVLLTPGDMVQYTRLALTTMVAHVLAAPMGYLVELRRLGYLPPERQYRPEALTLDDLLPPTTGSEARREVEILLRRVFDVGDAMQRHVAALLLWVVSRDRVVNLNVLEVLEVARYGLMAIGKRKKATTAVRSRDARLLQCFVALSAELRLKAVVNQKLHLVFDWKGVLDTARMQLLKVRAWADGNFRGPYIQVEPLFWDEFRRLDLLLDTGYLPGDEWERQFELVMVGAMLLYEVSPGSGVADVHALAAQNLQVEPTWFWRELQAQLLNDVCFMTPATFIHAVKLIRIARSEADFIPEAVKRDALDCARALASEILHCCGHLRIQLPQHDHVEAYFKALGDLPDAPSTVADHDALEMRAFEIIGAVSNLAAAADAQQRQEQERAELARLAAHTLPDERELDSRDDVEPPHMQRARDLLRDRHVVMIGGEVDEGRRRRLMDTFELSALDWIAADEYAHGTHAASRVRGKADVVLIAVRWMGHAHSTIKDVARADGAQVVYLPGGLNEQMVAWQVCSQCKQRSQPRRASLQA